MSSCHPGIIFMLYTYPMHIHHIFISPGHNYFGNPSGEPGEHPTFDVAQVEVRAGLGVVGDRFYGKGADFDGQITFFAWEVFQQLQTEFGNSVWTPVPLRRNVIIEGVPLNGLIGQDFTIDAIRFRGIKHCAPCRWMDRGFAPGARQFLKGRGGLRAQVLSDGVLQCGEAFLATEVELKLDQIVQPLLKPALPA